MDTEQKVNPDITITTSSGVTATVTAHHDKPVSVLRRIEYILNLIAQWIIGFISIYMSWLCLRTGLAGTALHAWLVTIGFLLLMAEGIMCHYNANLLTMNYKRSTKTTLHWVLQAVGGACGIAGVLYECIRHNFVFSGIHGKLGFSAFILCVCSMLTGLTALFSAPMKKLLHPLLNKGFHNLLGFATFALAMVALFYGYQFSLVSSGMPMDFVQTIQVLTMIVLILVSIGPLKALYHKFMMLIHKE